MWMQVKNRNWLYRIWYYCERQSKEFLFDCSSCGQCVLRSTALTCPMQCPKQLRNGPCGGSTDGFCEVYPGERPCIWTKIHRRARQGWMRRIMGPKWGKILPAIDWRLYGTSAWLNIWPAKKINLDGWAFSEKPVAPQGNRWTQAPEAPPATGKTETSHDSAGV